MGRCKATLAVGSQTILERLIAQLSMFDELLLSTNEPTLAGKLQVITVRDVFRDIGPLGGLHACLGATKKEAILVIPCDLPLYSSVVAKLLLEHIQPEQDALICQDGTSRIHPLCGIYKVRILPLLEEQIKAGEFRVRRFLNRVDCGVLSTGDLVANNVFFNMNTPQEYEDLFSL